MRILITDDNKPMRMLLIKALRELGYTEIAEAASGDLALSLAESKAYDLLFLDWNMPGMSGLEVLKQLRSLPATRELAVCMFTTEADKTRVLEALRYGLQGYLIKPLKREALEQKLAEIAAKRGLRMPLRPGPATAPVAAAVPEAPEGAAGSAASGAASSETDSGIPVV